MAQGPAPEKLSPLRSPVELSAHYLSRSSKNPGFESSKDSNLFRLILEYLDCPQYLRKPLFPMCLELKHIGVAPPLDASHHIR